MSPVHTAARHHLTAVFPVHHEDLRTLLRLPDRVHNIPSDLLSYIPEVVLHKDSLHS